MSYNPSGFAPLTHLPLHRGGKGYGDNHTTIPILPKTNEVPADQHLTDRDFYSKRVNLEKRK